MQALRASREFHLHRNVAAPVRYAGSSIVSEVIKGYLNRFLHHHTIPPAMTANTPVLGSGNVFDVRYQRDVQWERERVRKRACDEFAEHNSIAQCDLSF
jgi:hypothetical protein